MVTTKKASRLTSSLILTLVVGMGLAHAQTQPMGEKESPYHENQKQSGSAGGQSDAASGNANASSASDGTSSSTTADRVLSNSVGKDSGTSAAGSGEAPTKMRASDKKMMEELERANLAEIEISKLAQDQTKNQQVLEFAQKMIADHTEASSQLKEIAKAKGVTLPTEPDAKHQALAKKLSNLTDEQFDKRYMEHAGTKDHRASTALLKRIKEQAKDPELKALAAKTLPVVEQHLRMAKDHHQQMGNQSSGK